jgi:hypothetical protein
MKHLVNTLIAIGIVSASNMVLADNIVTTNQPVAQSSTVYGLDPIWNDVIARNQDNASGVVALYAGQTKISGLVIGDFTYNDNQDGYWQGSKVTSASAIFNLYDAELYADTQFNPYIRSHIALAYGAVGTSDGNPARSSVDVGAVSATSNPTTTSNFFFPEAYVTFFDNAHWFAKVGQEYLNFGNTTYQSITQPLPQVFTSMNATAVTGGVVNVLDGLYFDATAYNGNPYGVTTSTSFANSNAQAHGYVLDLGYTQEMVDEGYNVFVDYASNIDDSASIENNLANTAPMLQQTPAITAHADYHIGLITLNADYFSVVQRFNPNNWTYNGSGAKPSAYSLQGSYTLDLGQHPSDFVIAYEASQDAVNFVPLGAAFPMPESRFLVGYNFNLAQNVLLQVEYDNDQDYALGDTGLTFNGINFGSSSTDNSVLARVNVSF